MKHILTIALLAGILFTGCDSANEATVEYTGITRTNDKGEVVSRDEDDWKNVPPACTTGCLITNILAYPNPTTSTFKLTLTINNNAMVVDRIFVYDTHNFVVASLPRTFEKKGNHVGVIDLSGLAAGVYRVKCYATNIETQATYVMYGDVQKE